MLLRRMCLLVLGFSISTGICGIWFVLQQDTLPVVNGYAQEQALPIFVEGTDLLAEELLTYEGEYIEDTEFGEFVFVTGLILRNTGDQGILSATVKLRGSTDTLEFEATYIPPGESVMVLEKNRKESQDTHFFACTGTVIYDENDWLDNSSLHIQTQEDSSFVITNYTQHSVTDIQIYYKTIYPQPVFYIGGITHCYRINCIEAGETLQVFPEYFAANYSQIVCVKTEDATKKP